MSKVSISKWGKMVTKTEPPVLVNVTNLSTDEKIEVEISKGLSVKKRMEFTKSITEACFDMNDGQYIPFSKNVCFNIYLVDSFTNLNVGKDIEKIFNFIKSTDIVEKIISVNKSLVGELENEVSELVEWEKEKRAHSDKADEIYDLATSILGKFVDILDEAEDNLDFSKLEESLSSILDKLGSNEKNSSLLKALGDKKE